MVNSFRTRDTLDVNHRTYEIFSLRKLSRQHDVTRLPYTLKILLENLLRYEDGNTVKQGDIEALVNWKPQAEPETEIAFRPARVLMQDFTGVPAIVDLAAMRDAMTQLGGDPDRINPLQPAELVIDHSVQVDSFGSLNAIDLNSELEYRRNQERYSFLKWGQKAFSNFKVVPPDTGIVHQVNLEYLARVVFYKFADGVNQAYPDTLVGTDSHTTMINGLGVLGWGVGGIEAEAAMLGQPISMLIPQVVGFRLTGKLPEGATATDLVLTVVEILRKHGVVGKFVEFFGDGLDYLTLADRATIANMAPEYGATCGFFPVDRETLNYLKLSGRSELDIALVEAYAREQLMFWEPGVAEAQYTSVVELDLATVEPSLAGPKRPQDRVGLKDIKPRFLEALAALKQERNLVSKPVSTEINGDNGRAAGRRRGHCSHHFVHQHIQSFGHDWRRSGCPKGAGPGPEGETLGQDVPGPGITGSHRVPEKGRLDGCPAGARLPYRWLWLYHLHRQLGPPAGTGLEGHSCRQSVGMLRAVRESQFRRPGARGSTHELPGFATAGGGLCPGRSYGYRYPERTTG